MQVLQKVDVQTGPGLVRRLPLQWSIQLPELNKRWEVKALSPHYWLDTTFP